MITRRKFISQNGILLSLSALPGALVSFAPAGTKPETAVFDTIIIGGSYAGLSAALALGRAFRKVLVIDSGQPCNKQAPASHNFLTQDGEKPAVIRNKARQQVAAYKNVTFYDGLAISGSATSNGFIVKTQQGHQFTGKKLLLASGVKDVLPDIAGFSACWGTSIIHCPYCHGYEYGHQPTGIIANGDTAFELAQLISNWSKQLTVFTNGKSTLTTEQLQRIQKNQIGIVETDISRIEHQGAQLKALHLADGSRHPLQAAYARPKAIQHSDIHQQLGCELIPQGLIKTDASRRTSVPGVFACGDNSSFRSIATAVHSGSMAGFAINAELTGETF
ncbi:NAD(P)/FAD-dependent oxidoreductase [Chitinophaga flava]|uniref:Pyridine nucleotide-disulfide oxidoreductase n=1 Tax=Chitinophaga flava TaxID=2259036 RepID=A0A365XP44_9BACT|nr:NAD(P)/FAD-dependent oxidoreductase [Chitinophaga flava]RBL88077.1 pyridine nucleotide-disulfide oxidoreductase [Chitinophaga flava]